MLISVVKKFSILIIGCIVSGIVASQTALDLTPPAISHTTPDSFTPGKALQIDVEIVDDSGIEEAKLYYRATQVGSYNSVPLVTSFGNVYSTQLSTEKGQKTIQYYIEALDKGGNRVLEGNPTQPITITGAAGRSNILYIALGALAIGAIAAAAGGGSDDPVTTPSVSNRTVTINATVPE